MTLIKCPLLPVVALYSTGILAAWLLPVWLIPLFLVTGVIWLLALFPTRGRVPLLLLLVFLVGALNLSVRLQVFSPLDLRVRLGSEPALVTLRGTIEETPVLRVHDQNSEPTWRTLTRLRVESIQRDKGPWLSAEGSIAVSSPGPLTNLFAGQRVQVFGVAARPPPALAPGTFDYHHYLRLQGTYYQLKTANDRDWEVLSGTRPPLPDRFRAWAQAALSRGLPTEDESLRLQWALSLGWKTALTEEASEPFVQAATYHIFAVDGLRMAILFGIFFALLRALSVPRTIAGLILLPIIWFYVALTAWPASAIRAAVMLTVVILGWVLRRPFNPLNSLFAAAFIILTWEPRQLFQAGFQLSFLVVLVLILMLPPMIQRFRQAFAPDPLLPPQLRRRWSPALAVPARFFADLTYTSFAAWIGSIPLVAYYFQIITPISTPANILAVPLCVLVLVSNFLSLLFAAWLPAVAVIFNHAGWFCMETIRVSSIWFAEWPLAYRYVEPPGLYTTVLYYALLLGLVTGWFNRPQWRPAKLGTAVLAIAVWGCLQLPQLSTTRLTVLPLNGGFAVYCATHPATTRLLVDCGTTNSVQQVVKAFLRAQGVNFLPNLLLTHGDIKHVGGAEEVVSLFKVSSVWTSTTRFRSPVYRQELTRFASRSNLLATVSRGDQLGPWTILHPAPEDRFTLADESCIVLLGRFAGRPVLLLSDLGKRAQELLCERYPGLRADLVIAGLPANGEALSPQLLACLQPRTLIVADSEMPASERASANLRARLAASGIPVIYTRDSGAVTVDYRPDRCQILSATAGGAP